MEDLHNVEYRTERKRVRLRWNKNKMAVLSPGTKLICGKLKNVSL